MAKKVKCPECKSWAYYAVIPRYIWSRSGKPDVTISEARIIRCGVCGEIPADDAEVRRWKTIAWKNLIRDHDLDEDQCDSCGCPESSTGQFYRLTHEKLCYSCHQSKYGS